MRNLKDVKKCSVNDLKIAKQTVPVQSIRLNDKDKKAAEFLKKYPVPEKYFTQ